MTELSGMTPKEKVQESLRQNKMTSPEEQRVREEIEKILSGAETPERFPSGNILHSASLSITQVRNLSEDILSKFQKHYEGYLSPEEVEAKVEEAKTQERERIVNQLVHWQQDGTHLISSEAIQSLKEGKK